MFRAITRLAWISALLIGCSGEGSDVVEENVAGHCIYLNIFSNLEECREYRGAAWTAESGIDDCNGQMESTFGSGACPYDASLGYCAFEEDSDDLYHIVFPGDDTDDCASSEMGCELFGGGRFVPEPLCEPFVDDQDTDGIGSGGSVFQPGELICTDTSGAQTTDPSGADSCTWSTIGGCAEEDKKFIDYAECTPVLTQRPYVPVPQASYKTLESDPILINPTYIAEVDWAKRQAESCGCVCCHTNSVSPQGASIWDTEADGIWTDSFTDNGLAIMAGWIDSTSLGAHDPEDNNGFDRSRTGLPTTDIERMIAFFEGELGRRGRSADEFADATPTGGPLHTQSIFEPEPCENGEGVDASGKVSWSGGDARYVFILEEGSANPGAPPNLDEPDGTLWKLAVDYRDDAIADGFVYGQVPMGAKQMVPIDEPAPSLVPGRLYYIYAQRDVAIPITRCLFRYGSGGDEPVQPPGDDVDLAPWNDECAEDTDCVAPTNFCVKMPGAPTGYCSTHCDSGAACRANGAPAEWTCNAVNCSVEDYTWCGPESEIEESGNFLSICE